MRVIIKKWGNSASIRIPAAIMKAVHLKLNEAVEVRAENGHVTIEPARREYNLAQLLAEITPDNLHAEINVGPSVGKEIS